MQDFDTSTEDSDATSEEETRDSKRAKFREFAKHLLKRFVLFLSFGPGVLGFLWLLGRILKR